MNMSDVRVKVDAKHFELYNDLVQAGVVNGAHSLFFMSACVGFRQNRREEPTKRVEKFWSRTFTPEEWTCMYTMALQHGRGAFSVIQDDRQVMSLIEEFATAGLNLLIDTSLRDFMLKNTPEPRLDVGSSRDLAQLVLFELWQLSGDQPMTGPASTVGGA